MYSLCVVFCVSIACVTGRFGGDCDQKCHCKKVTDDCQATNGRCNSGCAQYFTGDTCQGNPLCTLPDVFYVQLYTYWEHALKTFEGDLMTKCLRLVVVACLCNYGMYTLQDI